MQETGCKLCLFAVATLMVGSVVGLCERGKSWWDRQRGVCIPCTNCDIALKQVVKVPCEIHRDAVCQSIYEMNIWPFTYDDLNTDSFPLEDDAETSVVENENVLRWTTQTVTFVVAASGCLVFFIVVLILTLYHNIQWRKFKLALQPGKKFIKYYF